MRVLTTTVIRNCARSLAKMDWCSPMPSWRPSKVRADLVADISTQYMQDAELLVAHILGRQTTTELYELMWKDSGSRFLSEEQQTHLNELVRRRCNGEPLQYVTGTQAFWSRDYIVNNSVLIPRADTETLIESAITLCEQSAQLRVLDLGTGSGCILLTVLGEFSNATGIGVDRSLEAITVANHNAARFGETFVQRSTFTQGDFTQLDQCEKVMIGAPFDVIFTNPPYIRQDELNSLEKQVRDFEPTEALVSGPTGLEAYEGIARSIAENRILDDGGMVFVEAGIHQSNDIVNVFEASGFVHVETHKDLAGIDRCVIFTSKNQNLQ